MKRMKLNKSLLVPFVEVFAKAISFANVLLLIRILNINDYADYSYIVAIVMWSSVLMDGGINSLIYNNSLRKDNSGIIRLFTGRFVLSVFVIGLISLFFAVKSPMLFLPATLFALVTYFSSSSALIKMLARGNGFSDVDLFSIVIEPILRLLILSFIYVTKNMYQYSLWSVLLLYLVSSIIAYSFNIKKINTRIVLGVQIDKLKNLLNIVSSSIKESKLYLLYYLALVGISRLDVIFIENNMTKSDLSLFSSAFNLYQVAQLFLSSIITSQFIKIKEIKYTIIKYIVPIISIIIIITFYISPYFYSVLFPTEYYEGYSLLQILIFSLLPSVINYYLITNNNNNNMVLANFIILFIVFVMKLLFYMNIEIEYVSTYAYANIGAEILVLIFLLIFKIKNESITDK